MYSTAGWTRRTRRSAGSSVTPTASSRCGSRSREVPRGVRRPVRDARRQPVWARDRRDRGTARGVRVPVRREPRGRRGRVAHLAGERVGPRLGARAPRRCTTGRGGRVRVGRRERRAGDLRRVAASGRRRGLRGGPSLPCRRVKRWLEIDGTAWAVLYLPDRIVKYRAAKAASTLDASQYENGQTPSVLAAPQNWRVDQTIPNPLGVVPVVQFTNRPALLTEGRSDLVDVIPLQDAVNKLRSDMLVAAEYAAYRQRFVVGLELEVDEETGQVTPPFRGRPSVGRGIGGSEVRRVRRVGPDQLRNCDLRHRPARRRHHRSSVALHRIEQRPVPVG